MSPSHCILILLVSFLTVCTADRPPMGLPTANEKKSTKLPPCQSCTKLVESFKKGMEKTERGKHEGGDAAWEEQRLGSYKRSEVRLVDIQEGLCNDIIVGQDQCHALAETNEHLLEEWWFKEQGDTADIFSWLCIDRLQVCCPPNKYGPNCDDCSDCNGNGKCKGNGTRKGNGKCSCDKGYKGESCNECETEYYESFRDDTKLLCSRCHHACDIGGCNTAGPKGCRVCKHGWSMQPELGGCVDIDECATIENTCTTNQFCVNSEGSYSCLECDKSCLGCSGDGPDLCDKCADGYELRDGMCKDVARLSEPVEPLDHLSDEL
ncbi:cysteine-rich with EGF-like domain protein 2 isoform X2 [Bradysia coprophila]|uniref:cysteine-rich with EGF-like domain protein 2 isoform X2 n=1 Tax=Bradysia coprophila TaxID=38358 RepID=UPI00187D8716|nr:cysteine-rich with EGF-like domain protein 2 isoform X2 [Bradysia coprophila]